MKNINEMISNIIQENPEPEQLNTALNSFLNTEVFIEEHINQLYQTLAHGRGIRGLVETADRFLKHPISVCDTSYNIIEASNSMRQMPYGMDFNQSHTFLNAEEIESLKRLQIEDRIYETKQAFFSRTADHPDNNWIFCAIRIQNVMAASKTARKPKLMAENSAMNRPACPLTCFVYSRKVMRLASDATSVPAPPMFTPTSNPG